MCSYNVAHELSFDCAGASGASGSHVSLLVSDLRGETHWYGPRTLFRNCMFCRLVSCLGYNARWSGFMLCPVSLASCHRCLQESHLSYVSCHISCRVWCGVSCHAWCLLSCSGSRVSCLSIWVARVCFLFGSIQALGSSRGVEKCREQLRFLKTELPLQGAFSLDSDRLAA